MNDNLKKIIYSPGLTAFFLLFTSCFNNRNCEKISLSKDELDWFKQINEDTVFFQAILNKEKDTFIIDVMKTPIYTTCNNYELGKYIYPSISLRFNCLDDYKISNIRKDYFLEFYKSNEDISSQNCQKGINFFELDVEPFDELKKLPQSKIKDPYSKDSIDVFRFRLGDNAQNIEGLVDIMAEFSISKKYGLISYQRLDSIRFERVW